MQEQKKCLKRIHVGWFEGLGYCYGEFGLEHSVIYLEALLVMGSIVPFLLRLDKDKEKPQYPLDKRLWCSI